MHRLGIRPSQVTMASIIQAFMETRNLKLGKFVHGCVFGLGMGYDVLVLTSLVDMNGKMGDVESAQSVIFLWDLNSKCGAMNKASFVFDQMSMLLAQA